jgi:peptide methionine sulfoxide reductase MsrA
LGESDEGAMHGLGSQRLGTEPRAPLRTRPGIGRHADRLHDPTTRNRQGNDVGTQYRSAIFPQSDEQRAAAERVIARVSASGRWQRPITTSIEPAGPWYSAEAYHQDYLRKHPGGYTCHYLRDE